MLPSLPLVALPRAPAIVAGVVHVRGAVAPVVDLRARFGLPPRPLGLDDHLILARARGRLVALPADRALELRAVAPGDVCAAAEVAAGADLVAGIARFSDGLVVIHDLDAFLTAAEEAALERALAGAAKASRRKEKRP